jgi:hypothetical protein
VWGLESLSIFAETLSTRQHQKTGIWYAFKLQLIDTDDKEDMAYNEYNR